MKKNTKLILIIVACVLAVVILVAGLFIVIKKMRPCTLKIDSKTVLSGDNVTLSVVLDNNPGIYVGAMSIKYDPKVLTFISCANGDVFDERVINGLDGEVVIVLNQTGLKDTKNDGVVVTLTFNVKETAPKGEHNVYFDFADREMTGFRNVKDPEKYIEFKFEHGKITVK